MGQAHTGPPGEKRREILPKDRDFPDPRVLITILFLFVLLLMQGGFGSRAAPPAPRTAIGAVGGR
jgi:hypothetical protein